MLAQAVKMAVDLQCRARMEFYMEWNIPQLRDGAWVRPIVAESDYMGSDAAFANIYLLRDKYDIKIAEYKGFLMRYYSGRGSRKGYTFPLGKGNPQRAILKIKKEAQEYGRPLEFCFVTEEQKQILEDVLQGELVFTSDRGDSDYIYDKQELSNLSGKAFHKKKNHVSKFIRSYPEYEYVELSAMNAEDAARVEDIWYNEHLSLEDSSALFEYGAIKEALENFEELSLFGGLIYVNGSPVAMTIGSQINEEICDIHFEKSIGDFAYNGGYAAINQFHVRGLSNYVYVNREEDIGIEGLRKAKESYHPKIMLKKYSACAIK